MITMDYTSVIIGGFLFSTFVGVLVFYIISCTIKRKHVFKH
jgi:hypothetical protein